MRRDRRKEMYEHWILIMGVSGSGKTTIGHELAKRIGGCFIDSDKFHSTKNVKKMMSGIPLNDADREYWLEKILEAIDARDGRKVIVISCSALKEAYRRRLSRIPHKLVYLKGTEEDIAKRLRGRTGHFMPAELLQSQFEALEEPANALVIPVTYSIEQIVNLIVDKLGLDKNQQ